MKVRKRLYAHLCLLILITLKTVSFIYVTIPNFSINYQNQQIIKEINRFNIQKFFIVFKLCYTVINKSVILIYSYNF